MIGEGRNPGKFGGAIRERPAAGTQNSLVTKTEGVEEISLVGGGGESQMRGCSAIKGNGERCKGIAATGSDYCPAHDPARAEDRRKAASKAAKSRHDPEIRRIRGLLQDLYAKVLQGEVGRQAAAVANQIAN